MKKISVSDLFKTILLLVAAIYISSFLIKFTGEENNSALIFVLAVFIISYFTDGYLWGVIASVVSTFCINYFFMSPYEKFDITTSGYPIALISLLIVSIATCTMTSLIKWQTQEAINREKKTKELYLLNQKLNEERTQILIDAEKEKMRGNLLRAISHDLRTPLTTIIGDTTLIIEDGEHMPKEEVIKLLSDIRDDSEWLIGMVENLLSVTHFQSDKTVLKTYPEIVEDVIADAVMKIKKRYPYSKIDISLPDEILLAPMDSMLIKQVLINLLENAIRHSGTPDQIRISCAQQDSFVYIDVEDHGVGLHDATFENSGDSTKGLGIGLPVCESIVKAHHGLFIKENRPDGGALFRVGLPLEVKNESI